MVGGVEDHYISEDDGAVASEKGEFVVVGPKGGSARGVSRNDLVPRAFGLVSVYEGVLGERCIVDADRECRLSSVAGAVVNHGGKCDCSESGRVKPPAVSSKA